MTKRKSRKEQTTQWPKEKGLFFSTFSFGHCVVCSFLLFLLVIVLSILSSSTFSFGHCVVSSFLLFLLVIVLSLLFYFFFWSTMTKRKSRKEQTTQ
jgi:glucan phosphoethanolaminetransferase (alkaline phosphatase superfamily)